MRGVLWRGHLVGVHVLQELAPQRLLRCAAFAGVQVQHVVEQVQRRGRDAEGGERLRDIVQHPITRWDLEELFPCDVPLVTSQVAVSNQIYDRVPPTQWALMTSRRLIHPSYIWMDTTISDITNGSVYPDVGWVVEPNLLIPHGGNNHWSKAQPVIPL